MDHVAESLVYLLCYLANEIRVAYLSSSEFSVIDGEVWVVEEGTGESNSGRKTRKMLGGGPGQGEGGDSNLSLTKVVPVEESDC